MKKRTEGLNFVISVAWIAIGTALPVAAQADLISGQATFEKRNTVVPMYICEAEPCAVSKPYWSLVIRGENARYELNHMFSLGNTRAPQTVSLSGAMIRPGAKVEVEGRVDLIGQDYAIVSDIRRATVLQEAEPATSPPAYGWKCRGQSQDNVDLYADVFYAPSSGPDHIYQIRVVEATREQDTSFYPVAIVESAQFNLGDQGFVYSGRYGATYVRLSIEQQPSQFSNLPASLSLMQGEFGEMGVRNQVELRCTRSR